MVEDGVRPRTYDCSKHASVHFQLLPSVDHPTTDCNEDELRTFRSISAASS